MLITSKAEARNVCTELLLGGRKRFVARKTTVTFLERIHELTITDPHSQWKLGYYSAVVMFTLGCQTPMLPYEAVAFDKVVFHEVSVLGFGFQWLFSDVCSMMCMIGVCGFVAFAF